MIHYIIIFIISSYYLFAYTIKDGVGDTLLYHPKIKAIKLQYEQQKSARAKLYGKFLPTIDVTASYAKVTEKITNSDTLSGPQIDKELNANINLFNGFSDYYEIKSRNYQVTSYKYEYLEMKNKIAFEFTSAYLEVVKSKELFKLAQAKLDKYRDLYQKELIKYDLKLSSLSFVSNIRSKFRLTQIELFEKQRVVEDKIASLSQYVDISKINEYYFPNFKPLLPSTIKVLLEEQRNNHYIIKKSQLEEKISYYEYKREYKTIMPEVNLSAKRAWSNNYYEENVDREKTTFSIDASYNIFSGASDYNKYIGGIQKYEEKQENTKKIIIELGYKLKLIWNEIKLEDAKLNILQHFIKARYDALEGAEYDFKFGKIDISIFLNSVSEFYGAREQYLNHRYATILSRFKLYNMIGNIDQVILNSKDIINEEIKLDDERFYQKSSNSKNIKLTNGIYIVKSAKSTIREEAKVSSKKLGEYKYLDEIKSVSIKDRWIKSDKGWIDSKHLIQKFRPKTRYTIKTSLNARKGPTLKEKVTGWFVKGDKVFGIKIQGHWVKTHKGWINGDYITVDLTNDTYYIVNASSLSIRVKPSLTSKIVGTYSDMSEIFSISEKLNWVRTDKGWISKKYLIKIDEKLE